MDWSKKYVANPINRISRIEIFSQSNAGEIFENQTTKIYVRAEHTFDKNITMSHVFYYSRQTAHRNFITERYNSLADFHIENVITSESFARVVFSSVFNKNRVISNVPIWCPFAWMPVSRYGNEFSRMCSVHLAVNHLARGKTRNSEKSGSQEEPSR